MIQPIININGTSRDEHIALRRAALNAIRNAIDAVRSLAPNGRDYPGQPERCEADRKAHFNRLAALHELKQEIMNEALAIQRGAD
jgi:hypothetical protein